MKSGMLHFHGIAFFCALYAVHSRVTRTRLRALAKQTAQQSSAQLENAVWHHEIPVLPRAHPRMTGKRFTDDVTGLSSKTLQNSMFFQTYLAISDRKAQVGANMKRLTPEDSEAQSWDTRKKSVVEEYKHLQNLSAKDVAEATLRLERLGASEESYDMRASNVLLSDNLREKMTLALRDKLHAQINEEKNARETIKTALDTLSPRGASANSAVKSQSFDGEWVVGKDCTSCDDVCSQNTTHQYCNATAMDTLNDNESVIHAVERAGLTCADTTEVPAVVGKWDGPWWSGAPPQEWKGEGKPSGLCGFVNGEFGESSCSAKTNCGWRRLCACSNKESPRDVPQKPGPFADIDVSLKLDSDLMQPSPGGGSELRSIVGPQTLKLLGRSCLVYSFGAGYQTGYEKLMAQFGCTIHVFDCTMVDSPTHLLSYLEEVSAIDNVIFHPWCVGKHDSEYHGAFGAAPSDAFFTLDEIMGKLGHSSVDIVKFDIEGFEWSLFKSLLGGKLLPNQIAFELHTYAAKPQAVPQHLVKYKGRREVVELFDQLYHFNYSVVSKNINQFDGACCEFVVVRA